MGLSVVVAASGNEILAERVLDIQDVCVQLLREVYGEESS
jgi:phosphoenolpyruvate-protein kinase (PTS system EI component)